jgi:GTP-binding protein
VLVHVIDGSSRDPLYDFKAIQNELEMFSPELLAKPQVFVLDSIIILSLVFVAM